MKKCQKTAGRRGGGDFLTHTVICELLKAIIFFYVPIGLVLRRDYDHIGQSYELLLTLSSSCLSDSSQVVCVSASSISDMSYCRCLTCMKTRSMTRLLLSSTAQETDDKNSITYDSFVLFYLFIACLLA